MNRHFVLAGLASCMFVPSCRVLSQRVDFSWFRDTLSAPQSDSVYVESGQGLPATELPAPRATDSSKPTYTPAPVAVAQTPVKAPAPAAAPVPVKAPAPAAVPTPAAAPVTSVRASGHTHTVAKGETLSSIARRYRSSVPAICTANGITNPDELKLGSVLTIPNFPGRVAPQAAPATAKRVAAAAPQKRQTPQAAAPKRYFWQFWKKNPAPQPTKTYTVRPGDTLNAIARRHGVTPAALMNANGMTRAQADKLRIGQNLILPTPKK